MIYHERKLIDVWDEVQPLLIEHWLELANHKEERPLDPDKDMYVKMNDTGFLRVFTAEDDGRIVGYCSFVMTNNLHYKTWMQATSDVYYLDPAYRKSPVSVEFFVEIERWLTSLGVKSIFVHDKINHSHEKFFTKLGFTPVEQVYEKVI